MRIGTSLRRTALATAILSLLVLSLAGCMTPQEEEAYYDEICRFDAVSFDELKPGSAPYAMCVDLARSGMGQEYDPEFGSYTRFYLFD